jgi:hypothetical protein
MAGSYRHVTNADGTFRGIDLIDNLGDAHEALEEMHQMIAYLATELAECDGQNDARHMVHEAWRYGVDRPRENTANEKLCSFDAFWEK